MAKRIVISQGHPDHHVPHFGHALAEMYAKGADEAGHEVRHVVVAALDFPLLRSQNDWGRQPCPASLQSAQDIHGADIPPGLCDPSCRAGKIP